MFCFLKFCKFSININKGVWTLANEMGINHIAIMMDGNGRWAQAKGEKRIVGHYYGEKKFEEVSGWMSSRGIDHFTVYAFSTENWKRPKEEVDAIMHLLGKYFEACINLAEQFSYKVNVIGRRDNLSEELCELINKVEETTKDNTGLSIHIAVNYGGRDELVRAFGKLHDQIKTEKAVSLSEDLIESFLDCHGVPDPDIVIRTGGEKRLSNFMLWELAYSELFFIDSFWPDFSEKELDSIIDDYLHRNRRYGAIK